MIVTTVVEELVSISGDADIIAARQRARELAKEIGFGALDQSRIATAVSELARNVLRYATGGVGQAVLRSVDPEDLGPGIEVVVQDAGPGIPDLNLAMQRGVTSGLGLGLGLPGTKRLMDEMNIETSTEGTTVTVRKWLHR